ncbi:UNVERIFIED_CONTAM: Gag-Pol polyprotein [Sesamum radiatum]|uniref:Gag-Pol polyprotein n=1 Tax=Sesamum radiatum TaxID=300843 RepID=A0AAW2QZY3_SESRA
MLVKSRKEEGHLSDLGKAFEVMREYGMKLNPSKCTFGMRGGKFLGYMVSERGIEANPKKIEAISKIQSPRTPKEVQKLTANPKQEKMLFLYLAVSDEAVSSVLVREQEKTQSPVYYVSKILQGAEKRYAQIEKLALALVITTRKLRPYFQSHKIIVLTNHPLGHIMNRPDASGRLVKWAVELGEYDIEYQSRRAIKAQVLADFVMEFAGEQAPEVKGAWLLHVDGSSNASNGGASILLQGPDGVEIEVAARLSFAATNNEAEYEALLLGLRLAIEAGAWCSRFPEAKNERADSLSKFGAMVSGVKSRKVTIMVKEHPSIEEQVEVQAVQEDGSWRTELIRYLKNATLPNDPIAAKRIKFKASRFTLVGDELYKRTINGPLLKCVDEKDAMYLLREIHEGSCGNHSGGDRLLKRFGIPRVLVSDNGTQFQGKAITAWCKELKIQQNFTAVGNPQANGQTEVTNRTILQHLKTRLDGAKKSWVEELPEVLWAYRTTPRSSTGETPFCLVYGTEAIIPVEIGEETQRIAQYEVASNHEECAFDLTVIEEKRDAAYARILHHKGLMMRSYNRRFMISYSSYVICGPEKG